MNSAGKSTVIQSLLLAIQNVTDDGISPLNGRLISLGDFSDARNFAKKSRYIELVLSKSENEMVQLNFTEENGNVVCHVQENSRDLLAFLDQKNKQVHYISSQRIGSQDLYKKNFNKHEDYGTLGEFAIDYFHKNKSNRIESYLIQDKTLGSTLDIQLNYWFKYILNSELSTEDIEGTDRVKAKYSHMNNRKVRPKNIGSGLSYVISILISALSSKMGDMIIIENPEIHLHPRAQSRLTEFLSFVADKGIKFIIETHSDHVFNGIRKSVNKKVITPSDVAIHFFKMDETELLSRPIKIEIGSNGSVKNHQRGLFDQFDDDLDELLGL